MEQTREIRIGDSLALGGSNPLMLIAGPCVIESSEICFEAAEKLKDLAEKLGLPFLFKASFDKANRTSIDSFRGPGLDKGLGILRAIRDTLKIPVTSDIHLPHQADEAGSVLDMLQIPAFLCRQTDLLVAAAETGKPVNIKKGQFLSPAEVSNIISKIDSTGNGNVCITERGTTFGYNRLINDFTGIPAIRALGAPVVFDATHSVQQPGGQGDRSGGNREAVPCLARAAAGVGIDGLFLETHPDPDQARSDGPNMMPIDMLEELLQDVIAIDGIVRKKE